LLWVGQSEKREGGKNGDATGEWRKRKNKSVFCNLSTVEKNVDFSTNNKLTLSV
jgi:hypothetical protein